MRVRELRHSSISPDYQKALGFTVQRAKSAWSKTALWAGVAGCEIKERRSEGAKMV